MSYFLAHCPRVLVVKFGPESGPGIMLFCYFHNDPKRGPGLYEESLSLLVNLVKMSPKLMKTSCCPNFTADSRDLNLHHVFLTFRTQNARPPFS